MKRLLLVFAVLSLLFPLSAKGGQEGSAADGKEKVKIVFWDENAGPNRTPFLQEIIRRFETQCDWVDVEYVGIPWKSAKEKYDVAVVSNTVPDIAGMTEMWLADYASKGVLVPLDEAFQAWDEKDQFIPGQIASIKTLSVDGKLYQIPNTSNCDVLWYRPDVFAEKGVAEVENWEDFFSAVETLTDKDANFYGFSIRGGAGGSHQLEAMLVSYSGIDSYFDESGRCLINAPESVAFLERFAGLYKEYTPISDISNGYKEMIAVFDSGSVGMIHHNLGSAKEHRENLGPGKYAAMPLPRSVKGRYNLLTGTGGYAIFKTTEERQKAAWEFMKFLCSEESISYWNENIGQFPTRRDVLKQEWVQEIQHYTAASKAMEADGTVIINPPRFLPGYSSIHYDILRPGLQEVLTGQKSSQDYLDEWARAMEQEYKEFQKAFK